MAQTRRSIKVFVLQFFIYLVINVSIFTLVFNILPRYIRLVDNPYTLRQVVLMSVIAALLSALIYVFLLEKIYRFLGVKQ